MFFSAFHGRHTALQNWENTVREQCVRLNLKPHFYVNSGQDDKYLSYCFMRPPNQNGFSIEGLTPLVFWSSGEQVVPWTELYSTDALVKLLESSVRNDLLISIDTDQRKLAILVSLASPEQFYYIWDGNQLILGNDLRLMARFTDSSLEPTAVYSLFQFLSVPAPLTIFKDVRRVPGGHYLEASFQDLEPEITITSFAGLNDSELSSVSRSPEAAVASLLDRTVQSAPRPTTLLFSGGVDSSLLLWQMLELGLEDFELVNFSFGNQDEESQLASSIAAHLNVNCRVVDFQLSELQPFLDRIARDYSYPFGDLSVVPTNILIHGAMNLFPKTKSVIDGTGADGLFAVGEKYEGWSRIYRLPLWTRIVASNIYRRVGLWRGVSSAEFFGRLLRRSVQMPLHQAAIMAQNALDGIAYHIPPEVHEELDSIVYEFILQPVSALPSEEQLTLVDVMHICAGQFATKSFDPLRHHGVGVRYPFISPKMVRCASTLPWSSKSSKDEPKAILKKLLSKGLPRDYIYRPKSGFNPPIRQMLAAPIVQEYVHEIVLAKSNDFLDYCDLPVVRTVLDRVAQQAEVSIGAYNFAWVLIFSSLWLDQLKHN